MPEPVLTSLTLGVAGNLASNVIQSLAGKIENTRAGKTLSRLGLMSPGFEARVENAMKEAVEVFLKENTLYNIPEVHAFLEGKAFARDIKDMLLEQRGLDAQKVMERLETYVGVPLTEAPDSWPNKIDPAIFVRQLFQAFNETLALQADEGILWLGQAVAQHGLVLHTISDKLDKVLDHSQKTSREFQQDEFLQAYLDHVTGRAQKVSTPGARELRGINQSLSVAYISLNLKSATGSEAVRAEDFLSQHPHVSIRGPAGSGKTTLLSWLITKCGPASDDAKWENYVPFFIPLRKVARLHSGPPTVDQLVDYSVDNKLWTHDTPKGWINKILNSNTRAILMIDGVDELPPSRRVEFWEWVEDFVEEYPLSRVIITSRALPGAPADGSFHEQWNPPKSFVDAQLQDMSDADVTNFIHHWHDAIDRTKLEDQELVSLNEARASLPAKLEDAANRRIRELCNTPLLCAMICVLHWKEEGYLPRQRVEVYERCCDMLIEARDLKRGVQPPPGPISAMSKSDKEMVLQQLAIEMMHNRDDVESATDDSYRIEISREKALAWIHPRITRFQSNEARQALATEVLDYLVERTGLLREPAKELIDFPHRTFQEYLAACAAGADSQEVMLARQVDDDQWHETIMLAAGTSTGGVGFGQRLIETLIRRGERNQSSKERSQKIRKTCFALALGCLENLRQQDENLRESVLAHLSELVPPRSEGDARILSVAGDAAVSHLAYSRWKDENTATVAACARALRLIGTTEALKALSRGYINDSRYNVISEVCKTGHVPFNEIPLVADEVERTGRIPHFATCTDLSLVVGLNGLKEIDLDASETKGLERIGELASLEAITFERLTAGSTFLDALPRTLRTIRLQGSGLPDGNWIGQLQSLTNATIIGMSEFEALRVIEGAIELKDIAIVGSNFRDANALKRLMNLESLYLAGLSDFTDVNALADHNTLENLVLEDCRQLSSIPLDAGYGRLKSLQIEQPRSKMVLSGRLETGSELRKLHLSEVSGVESLEPFAEASKLEAVELFDCRGLKDVSALSNLSQLREVDLGSLNLASLVELPGLRLERISLGSVSAVTGNSFSGGLPAATAVTIERCVKIESLDFLQNSTNLSTLRLSTMPRISSLGPLAGKLYLTSLDLIDCDGISSLHALQGMPLEELSLLSMEGLRDIESIGALQSLRSLTIANCGNISDLSFATDLPNLETIWIHDVSGNVHIPESLRPKIARAIPNRLMYYRHRKPWWPSDAWVVRDARRFHFDMHWTRPGYYP